MNDRYLFKAKDCNSIWRAGLLIALQEGRCAIEEKDGSKWACNSKTICQCTGLKDKNGKLIWENDIVKKEFYTDYDAFANSEEYIGVVKYEDCAWVIETKRNNLICTRPIIESMAYSDDVKHFEVIGNIFDNPELINE